MAEQPLTHMSVQLNGSAAPADFMDDLIDIAIENSLHLPGVATLTLHDPGLYWLDYDGLLPGKDIKIFVKKGSQETLLFDGEIVEIEPHFGRGAQELTVRAFDRLYKLSRGTCTRSFVNVSDSDIISKIAGEVGLSAQVGPASTTYPYVFQNNESNLAFLQKRAAALGYLLYVTGKTLHCKAPKGTTTVQLAWGVELREFYPRMTTLGQVDTVSVRGWDPDQKQAVQGQAKKEQQSAPQVGSGAGTGQVRQAFYMGGQKLVADRPIRAQAVAESLAKAVASQVAGSFIEAEGLCQGTPNLIAGVSVQISKVGKRFSGTYFVTGTQHLYNARQGYVTRFTVSGHQPATLFALLNTEEKIEAQRGLVVGIVTDNQDPTGQGRVKVKYPWLTEEHSSDWARVIAPGAGAQRGVQFLPEVNDEVLVGFEMGDINYPYVLGGLWNGQDKLPKDVVSGGKVQQRIICSRTGHMITLDDNDSGGGITIEDSKGNKLVFNSQENKLTITVQGDTEIQAQGNMKLGAQGNLTLQAQGNISLQATAEAEVKGTAGVKVDGGASIVEVKGSMINLN